MKLKSIFELWFPLLTKGNDQAIFSHIKKKLIMSMIKISIIITMIMGIEIKEIIIAAEKNSMDLFSTFMLYITKWLLSR